MATRVPTLPTDGSKDKVLDVHSREVVEASDFRFISSGLTDRLANWFRTVVSDVDNIVVQGFVTKQQAAPNMSVRITPEAGGAYSSAIQSGFVIKEVSASVTVTIDSEAGGVARYDIVSIRYIEDETDTVTRAQVTQAVVSAVVDEVLPNGDGTTRLYTLAHPGVLPGTVIASVNGVPVSQSIVPGTGVGGVDQIVFADPPTAAATIRITYKWLSGGVEQQQSLFTRFSGGIEYLYTKGTPGGGVPATPAGYMKLAEVGPITNATVDVRDTSDADSAGITKKRIFWWGAEHATVDGTGPFGTIQQLISTTGGLFFRNGIFPIINMILATTLHLRRTANTTDTEAMLKVYQRGSSSLIPSIFDRTGVLYRNHKRIREEFENLSYDTTGTDKTKRWNAAVASGTTTLSLVSGVSSSENGAAFLQTGGTNGNEAALRSWGDLDISSGAGAGGSVAAENRTRMVWVVRNPAGHTTKVHVQLGLYSATNSRFVAGFEINTDGFGGVTNWTANIVTAGPTQNRTDTGVAISSNYKTFEMVQGIAANVWQFLIEGALVATVSLAPLDSVELRYHTYVETLENAAKNFNMKLLDFGMGPITTAL